SRCGKKSPAAHKKRCPTTSLAPFEHRPKCHLGQTRYPPRMNDRSISAGSRANLGRVEFLTSRHCAREYSDICPRQCGTYYRPDRWSLLRYRAEPAEQIARRTKSRRCSARGPVPVSLSNRAKKSPLAAPVTEQPYKKSVAISIGNKDVSSNPRPKTPSDAYAETTFVLFAAAVGLQFPYS